MQETATERINQQRCTGTTLGGQGAAEDDTEIQGFSHVVRGLWDDEVVVVSS